MKKITHQTMRSRQWGGGAKAARFLGKRAALEGVCLLFLLAAFFGAPAEVRAQSNCGVLDDFNRADSTNMGANWTESSGGSDLAIAGNRAVRVVNNSAMNFNGSTPSDRVCADVYSGGSALQYGGLYIKYAGYQDNLFVNVQDNNNSGDYDRIFFSRDTGFNYNAACANFAISSPFTSARLTVYLDGTTLKADIDTNFDNIADQSYSCGGAPARNGTSIGLAIFGPTQMDNFGTPLTTLTVTKTADTNDGVCSASDCSLREAVAAANASAANDLITFTIPPTDADCAGGVCTVRLGGTQLTINDASTAGTLTISNPNGTAANLLVSGNNASRVFNVVSGANLTLNNLTVTDGRVTGGNNFGGGIFNLGGTITLTNCAVSNNVLSGSNNLGGGIYNGGTLTLTNSTVSNNSITGGTNSNGFGGGIANEFGTVNITGSTVSNNSITGSNATNGGGIYSLQGTLNITGSTVSNNSASGGSFENYGGGIYAKGPSTVGITNSTISGNSVTGSGLNQGGGIYLLFSTVTLNLTNSTVSNNSAIGGSSNGGGGIFANGSPTVNARNNIISGNTAGSLPDYNAGFNVNDSNLIGNAAQVRLAPLGFYGGQTMTHALLSGSTAINTGNNCVLNQSCTGFNAPVALPADQRGAGRVGQVDIGAFEVNNSANGGSYVAVLPNGTQAVAYNFVIAPNNGAFTYTVTGGSLPNGVNLTTNLAPNAVVALTGTPMQGGTFNFQITASDGTNTNVTNYALSILAPTAAAVSVSGRVLTPDGNGLRNAVVTMTDANGNSRSYRTGTFGYFRFENVGAGQTYVLEVQSKRFSFAPQVVAVNEDLTEVNFVAGDVF